MPLILYGRSLSPFARRVAVWCALQGREVERRKITVMGEDFETLKGLNPVGRVPVLVTEDGAHLIETAAILDWLEETAPEGRRVLPPSGEARREAMQEMAFGNSVVEKGVALVYEKNRRPEQYQWPEWRERLEGQITGGLAAMEAHAPEDGWLGGEGPGAGDLAFVIAHDFLGATNPYLLDAGYPKLKALATRADALPAFAESRPET